MQPCLYERYKCAICHNMMYLKTKETPNPKCEECDSINVEHEGLGPVDGYYQRVVEFHVAQDKDWNL